MDKNLIIEIIGYVAAFCTTFAFLPQVIKVIKTKDTSSISLGMYFIYIIGVTCWLIFGLMTNYLSIILANIITFILALVVIILKLKYK